MLGAYKKFKETLEYKNIADMLSQQLLQKTGGFMLVNDASEDPNIEWEDAEEKRQAFYKFKGDNSKSIDDYQLISAPYSSNNSGGSLIEKTSELINDGDGSSSFPTIDWIYNEGFLGGWNLVSGKNIMIIPGSWNNYTISCVITRVSQLEIDVFGDTAGKIMEGNDTRLLEAFAKKVNGVAVTGDTNKTITLTREDGTVLTASFLDNNDPQFPDDVINFLEFNLNNDGVLVAITSEGEIISVSLDGRYSLLGHTHTISDITGLQALLDSKSTQTLEAGSQITIVDNKINVSLPTHSLSDLETGRNLSGLINGATINQWLNGKNYVPDAPDDGITYARKDATWVALPEPPDTRTQIIYQEEDTCWLVDTMSNDVVIVIREDSTSTEICLQAGLTNAGKKIKVVNYKTSPINVSNSSTNLMNNNTPITTFSAKGAYNFVVQDTPNKNELILTGFETLPSGLGIS